ncbi:MAG TPA: magnesium transporter [Gemmataceae bacterium]|jgi:magnesium transporter|nr:magnesium transporter [Gemmataceae bacterium]
MAHALFGPEVRMMLLDKNPASMKAFVETLNPMTVAETLSGDAFTVEEVWEVLGKAEPREQAKVFEFFPIDFQVTMAKGAGRPQMARLIELMSHDDRVDLLRRLPAQVSEALLRLVDEADRRDIASLSRYGENTVGAIMTSDYAWLPADLTAKQAIERLRAQAPDRETIYYVYIVDEPTRRMLGILTLRALVLADPNTSIRQIMLVNDLVSLKAADDREVAAEALRRYGLIAIPVLDNDGRLVGIVTHDDIVEVISQEATEDLQKQGAVGPFRGNYLETGLFTIWWKRASWLCLLFAAELATFTVMAEFDEALQAILVLSLFVPLCLSTGGNSGSQAATIITRELALGHIVVKNWWRVLRHEIVMGLMLGLTLGAIGLFRGASTSEDLRSARKEMEAAIQVVLPADQEFKPDEHGAYAVPEGTPIAAREPVKRRTHITPPKGMTPERIERGEEVVYTFPPTTETQTETVGRWRFGLVICIAVSFICLWGTLIGSMLPLIFHQIGADPALASSPFVATFVDVTGIAAYFTIATMLLF